MRPVRSLLLILSVALFASGQPRPPHVIILGYHEVTPNGLPPAMRIARESRAPESAPMDEEMRYTISTADFQRQLDVLAEHDYEIVPLSDVVAWVTGTKPDLPERCAVITADDGWSSFAMHAVPELRKRSEPATLFVYPRVIERHDHHPDNMTWNAVVKVGKDGFAIESHSWSHAFMSRSRHAELDDTQYGAWLTDELAHSRSEIAAHTGQDVNFLAYPYGDYDAGVIAAARAAGYSAALTVKPGAITKLTNPFALGRYLVVHDTTLEQFESWLLPKVTSEQSSQQGPSGKSAAPAGGQIPPPRIDG